MKPRYYIKELSDDGRVIDIRGYGERRFDSFDDAVAFLDRHDIHGAVVITVIEREK